MPKLVLIAGVAALVLPCAAKAQTGCWRQHQDNQVAGAAVGAGAGALIGSAVASPGDRGAGAVIGAIGGGTVGAAVGGSTADCAHVAPAGYYDGDGVWHQASGYYDGSGRWVETAPAAGDVGTDVAATGGPLDLAAREAGLEARIHKGDASGAISRGDAEHDFDVLSGIRQY